MSNTRESGVRTYHRVGDTIRYVNAEPDRGTTGHSVPQAFTGGNPVRKLIATENRTASINDGAGYVSFTQPVTEVPVSWSENAVNIVASKYFRGQMGTPEREQSVIKLIERVAGTIADWGGKGGYFASLQDQTNFFDELSFMLATQMFAFNSPVWFNVGVPGEEHPQCSACFINSVTDDMESIMALASTEARLFKGGSGAGCNLSPLRSSKEFLSGGGSASGPVSFMRGYDAFAGVIKSGGKTRRAAKMVMLNADHPDVMDFIACKVNEEKKAWALIEQGYDGTFTGEAYNSVFFQNANHSVRVSDEFMKAAESDELWDLKAVKTGDALDTVKAKEMLMAIAEATHICGDPGLQYDTTINKWHTCMDTDRIHGSNPCSEFMFLNDTACNLGSLNLLKFYDKTSGMFMVEAFKHACRIAILAQEIIVDYSSYPTAKIAQNSHDYRPLGLGYANLGALLMTMGLPYDSEEGRAVAASITALMSGTAYCMSADIAKDRGPFVGYESNKEWMLGVIAAHNRWALALPAIHDSKLRFAAQESWRDAQVLGAQAGFRNSQVTVLAPTGTIAFMMDCDTTGIEPDIALVKYKRLVGGGMLKIVNHSVAPALVMLGYSGAERACILDHIDKHETIEGSPDLSAKHLPVFDCAFKAKNGKRSIEPMGHVKMMAATQPFISGAISKTVNVPEDATVQDIYNMYVEGWKLGLKAIAIYRDNCKRSQPLSTDKKAQSGKCIAEKPVESAGPRIAEREKLPTDRNALTHKFSIGGHDGYITTGFYPDGRPGEVFVCMNKQGSTTSGLMDTIAILTSMLLQYGVPLDVLVRRLSHTRFEPSGFTGNPDVPMAKSVVDYLFRFLGAKFLNKPQVIPQIIKDLPQIVKAEVKEDADHAGAPACSECGEITRRAGSCFICASCGTSTGCG